MAWIVAAGGSAFLAMAQGPGSAAWDGGWMGLALVAAAPVILAGLWWFDVIRPGSFRRRRGRDVSGLPTAVWLMAGLVALFAPAVGAGLAGMLPAGVRGAAGSMREEAVSAVCMYGVGIGVVAFLVFALAARAGGGAGMVPRGRDVVYAAGAFVLAFPVMQGVGALGVVVHTWVTGSAPAEIAHPSLERILTHPGSVWAWVLIGAAVLGAPIVEEYVYRVFLQSAVLRWTGSAWAAVLGSAAVFALVHRAVPVPWHAIPVLFAVGAAAGIVYERTGRVGAAIGMHAMFNAANVALAVWG